MKRPRKPPARLRRKAPAVSPEVEQAVAAIEAATGETAASRRLVVQGVEHSGATLPTGERCMVLRLHGIDGHGMRVHFDVGVEAATIDEFQMAMHQAIAAFKEEQAKGA